MIEQISPIGFILAVVASMAIGAVWYTALSQPWIRANGFNAKQISEIEAGGGAGVYGIAALCHAVMAFVLSFVLYHTQNLTLAGGLATGLVCWIGFVVTTMSVNHRFQMKPWSLTIIDAGHYLLILLAQGALIGWFSGGA